MNNMLDLETADNAPTSAIISIGAVHFTDELSKHEFYVAVKPESAIRYGTVSMATIQWWMKQSDLARQAWNDEEAVDLDVALMRFTDWVMGFKAKSGALMWGNGSDFDNVILANAYRNVGAKQPWKYTNNRCFRTLKGMFHQDRINELYKKYDTGTEGNRHNALYDARLQANMALEMLGRL